MIYYSFVCNRLVRAEQGLIYRGLAFSIGKESRAALEGAPREHREKVIDDTKPYRAPANLLGLAYMDFPAIREVPYFLPLSYLTLDSDGFCSRFSSCKRKRGNALCSQEIAIRFFNSLLTGDI